MWFRSLFASAFLICAAGAVSAQNFPEKAVTMIVPFPAGGSADLIARAVAEHMTATWKQNVLVTNRPGASGNIGSEAVVRAAPDGYTLLYGTTALSSSPAVYSKLGYNVLTDLAPVGMVVNQANVLVVHPSLPAKTIKELIALDRSHPKTLNSASAGVGSSNHLALVLFNMLSGTKIGHVPYKGAAPANTPRDIVLKINQAVHTALASPRVQELLSRSGTEVVTDTPEEFGRFLKSEVEKWGKVVKAAGIPMQ